MFRKKLAKAGVVGILAAAMLGVSVCYAGAEEFSSEEVTAAEDSVPAEAVEVVTGLNVTFLTVTGEVVGTDYAEITSENRPGESYIFTLGEDFFLPEGYELVPGVPQAQDIPIPYGIVGQYAMIVRQAEVVEPTETPTPEPTPTEEPEDPEPTDTPTPEPTEEPEDPEPTPTEEPEDPEPTVVPTEEPTAVPTEEPADVPVVTAVPVEEETAEQTKAVQTGDATDTLKLVLPIGIGAAGAAVLVTAKKRAKDAR